MLGVRFKLCANMLLDVALRKVTSNKREIPKLPLWTSQLAGLCLIMADVLEHADRGKY